MQTEFLISGGLILLAAKFLLLCRAYPRGRGGVRYGLLPYPYKAAFLLRRCLRITAGDVPASWDTAVLLSLLEELLQSKSAFRNAPKLPFQHGIPRLMDAAVQAVDEGNFAADALRDAFPAEDTPSSAEAAAFPLCIKLAQWYRVSLVLRTIIRDERERKRARRLARRMTHSRRPMRRLDHCRLTPVGRHELLRCLQASQKHEIFRAAAHWLESRGMTSASLSRDYLRHKTRLAEELRRAEACFQALNRLDWLTVSEALDDVHAQLMAASAPAYPMLTPTSRQTLRLHLESLCRMTRLPPDTVIRSILSLCRQEEPGSPESSFPYWLEDAKGITALHRALPVRRGWLYARLLHRRPAVLRACLWLFSLLCGFSFLHLRQPVWMLPFFLLCTGAVIRRWLPREAPLSAYACNLPEDREALRTLVILPAVITDAHCAVRLVRRLKLLLPTFPDSGVEFLLLGDFADSRTAVSRDDAAIVQAAAAAMAALDDRRCHYIQRGRAWDENSLAYTPRGGRRGAVTEICRLIAQGECADVIAFSTLDIAGLERSFAYVFPISPEEQLAPGAFELLLQTMMHPLCTRYPAANGWRGYAILAPQGCRRFTGTGLIRPDAYLEATDEYVDVRLKADALCGELAGYAAVAGAHLHTPGIPDSPDSACLSAAEDWQLLPWQFPWVQTPGGFVANPLHSASRFLLREALRAHLVPLGQFLLLLWSLLTGSWGLLLLALLPLLVQHPPRTVRDWLLLGRQLSLLPTRAIIPLHAAIALIRRRNPADFLPVLEVWVQGIATAVLGALTIALPHMSLPCLILTFVFGCFPLAHRISIVPDHTEEGISSPQEDLLRDAADKTWRYFTQPEISDSLPLPPCSLEYDPPLGPESVTSPQAIGAMICACVCAVDLGLTDAEAAADRLAGVFEQLAQLPRSNGLPCKTYDLPSLAVKDAGVDAAAVGFLCASLLTAAQALRCWLPALPARHLSLSAQAQSLADSLSLSALYDTEANLFYASLDKDGQPTGHIEHFTDEALLLSVSAFVLDLIPPAHFDRLRYPAVRCRGKRVPLSHTGAAAAHLLPGLFLPYGEDSAVAYIRIMAAHGRSGLMGTAACAAWQFDASLRYRTTVFGVPACSRTATDARPVYAPYAAALCLPFAPRDAAAALEHFSALGAIGPFGFADAVDCTQDPPAVIGLHQTWHQGILLSALAHTLADAPLRRYFCAIPRTAACLPLLLYKRPSVLLPAMRHSNPSPGVPEDLILSADASACPPDLMLLGTERFRILVDAQGSSCIYDQDVPLTRRATRGPYGIQFYLIDEGQVFRVSDPRIPGQVTFSPGEARFERLCGSIRSQLHFTADTIRRQALCSLTLTNLSTLDRIIELADCCLPDLGVLVGTLECTEQAGALVLHARGRSMTLRHSFSSSCQPAKVSFCTDADAFLGRSGTLFSPASLHAPAVSYAESAPQPCLSFRIKLPLGGRSQITLCFALSLEEEAVPTPDTLEGIRRLSAMQQTAILEAAALDAELLPLCPVFCALHESTPEGLFAALSSTEDFPQLDALTALAHWLSMHGIKPRLTILATQALCHEALLHLDGHPGLELLRFRTDTEMPGRGILLQCSQPLSQQLNRLRRHMLPTAFSVKPPQPAALPSVPLIHPCPYGGFDAETGHFIITLKPGQSLPGSWMNLHSHRGYREYADDTGIIHPLREQVFLRTDDAVLLSPHSSALPRCMRMEAGATIWEAWSDKLDLRLTAGCMPHHRCAFRFLRVRNTSSEQQALHVLVCADTDDDELFRAEDSVCFRLRDGSTAFLAGPDWQAKRICTPPWEEHPAPAAFIGQDTADGHLAVLECQLCIAPHSSREVRWLSGHCRHAEDIASALGALTASTGASLLRRLRESLSPALSRLRISTPEPTLDLLMNHILPQQCLAAAGFEEIPLLALLAPDKAKYALLKQLRQAAHPEDWLAIAPMLADYVSLTLDRSVLDVYLPGCSASPFDQCVAVLTSLPLDRDGLPSDGDPALTCFRYAYALKQLNTLRPSPALQEWVRKLCNAADIYLWRQDHYGDRLRLDTQALAFSVLGAAPRTLQGLRTAWQRLYDQLHGLLRLQEAGDAAPLPGLPENGGMVTLEAVRFLRCLWEADMHREAYELMQALNPVHHTDTPSRMAVFRGAPNRLPGGMLAAPLSAGQAVEAGGSAAGAQLYSILLHSFLGFHLQGKHFTLSPCVPSDWAGFSITLQMGASTWHICADKKTTETIIDGVSTDDPTCSLFDDGRIHQISLPLT